MQGFFLEWEQRLIPVQNTGNILKCFGITSDTSKYAGKRHLWNRSACKTNLTNITFLIVLSSGLLKPEDRTLQSIQIVHIDNTLYIVIITIFVSHIINQFFCLTFPFFTLITCTSSGMLSLNLICLFLILLKYYFYMYQRRRSR